MGRSIPGIIRYPFWRMTAQNPQAVYACINAQQQPTPPEIAWQAVCLQGGTVLEQLKG